MTDVAVLTLTKCCILEISKKIILYIFHLNVCHYEEQLKTHKGIFPEMHFLKIQLLLVDQPRFVGRSSKLVILSSLTLPETEKRKSKVD